MDAHTKAVAIWHSRRRSGSASGFLAGSTGDNHFDDGLNHAISNIFLDEIKRVFGLVRRWCVVFDQGPFGGLSYNLGSIIPQILIKHVCFLSRSSEPKPL